MGLILVSTFKIPVRISTYPNTYCLVLYLFSLVSNFRLSTSLKTMKSRAHLLMLFFLLFFVDSYAQDFNKDQVIEEARNQFTALSAETGELKKFCQEKNITGEFVFDITLQGKGKVLTVFMVSSSTEELNNQNLLKAKLTETQFNNIKIPKKERVKFRHTLIF